MWSQLICLVSVLSTVTDIICPRFFQQYHNFCLAVTVTLPTLSQGGRFTPSSWLKDIVCFPQKIDTPNISINQIKQYFAKLKTWTLNEEKNSNTNSASSFILPPSSWMGTLLGAGREVSCRDHVGSEGLKVK